MRTALALAAAVLLVPSASGQTLALTGATLYDGTGRPPIPDATLIVRDGRVACAGSASACPVPAGAETVDLAGQFITPGLVDAHVHFGQTGWLDGRPESRVGTDVYEQATIQRGLEATPERWQRAYLCSGITSVFDVGGPMWTLGLEAAAEDDLERPRVRAAGPILAALPAALAFPSFTSMLTDSAAVANVRRLAAAGARAIKVYYLDTPPDLRDAIDARVRLIGREARAAGIPMIVHATELRTATLALRAGASILVHSVDDVPVDSTFLALARASDVTLIPTLAVVSNWERALASVAFGTAAEIDDPNGCVDAETRRVIADAPMLSEQMRASGTVPPWLTPRAAIEALQTGGATQQRMKDNLRRLHDAGIRIAMGTDAGNPLTVHGPSVYAELEAMEAAGIPPSDVLVMATRNGAHAMGEVDGGTLEPGHVADLVILTDDPGASARAWRSITHVARRGVLQPVAHFAAR